MESEFRNMRKMFTVLLALAMILALGAPAWCQPDQPGFTGSGQGLGMGPRYMRGPGQGMGPSFQGWEGMTEKERKAYHQAWAQFMQSSLDLRQKLVTKQMALDTMWAQPQVDKDKVRDLADEVADLWNELEKKRNRYLTDCRIQFGDQGWTCPMSGLGSGSYYK
jgi:Spy/CpxP family protein refolding chaperone